MKQLALEALDTAVRRGVAYADVRVLEIRDRQVATKNGKAGHVSSSVSMGLGIRVLAGDRGTIEMSPYDLTKGRITYRHK